MHKARATRPICTQNMTHSVNDNRGGRTPTPSDPIRSPTGQSYRCVVTGSVVLRTSERATKTSRYYQLNGVEYRDTGRPMPARCSTGSLGVSLFVSRRQTKSIGSDPIRLKILITSVIKIRKKPFYVYTI
jgi:hypothetical protein